MIKYVLSNNSQPDTVLGTKIYVILLNPYRNPSKGKYYPHLQMRKQAQRAGITKPQMLSFQNTLISKSP